MHFTTRRALLVAHLAWSTSGAEREQYDNMLQRFWQRDLEFLRNQGYMEHGSVKLTMKGTNFANGMLNVYENNPIDNANYWLMKSIKLLENDRVTPEQFNNLLWEAFAQMPQEYQQRVLQLQTDDFNTAVQVANEEIVDEEEWEEEHEEIKSE